MVGTGKSWQLMVGYDSHYPWSRSLGSLFLITEGRPLGVPFHAARLPRQSASFSVVVTSNHRCLSETLLKIIILVWSQGTPIRVAFFWCFSEFSTFVIIPWQDGQPIQTMLEISHAKPKAGHTRKLPGNPSQYQIHLDFFFPKILLESIGYGPCEESHASSCSNRHEVNGYPGPNTENFLLARLPATQRVAQLGRWVRASPVHCWEVATAKVRCELVYWEPSNQGKIIILKSSPGTCSHLLTWGSRPSTFSRHAKNKQSRQAIGIGGWLWVNGSILTYQ